MAIDNGERQTHSSRQPYEKPYENLSFFLLLTSPRVESMVNRVGLSIFPWRGEDRSTGVPRLRYIVISTDIYTLVHR